MKKALLLFLVAIFLYPTLSYSSSWEEYEAWRDGHKRQMELRELEDEVDRQRRQNRDFKYELERQKRQQRQQRERDRLDKFYRDYLR